MRIILSGFNIDRVVFEDCDDNIKTLLTPEVFSSAYAKISRSSKTIPELRNEALENIEKARKLNQKIIFDFGHSSVAEHAVFNIDILGISRLAIEYLQSIKYASFTEKSQRYVTFGKDFHIPAEIKDNDIKAKIKSLFDLSFDNYKGIISDLYEKLKPNYKESEHRNLMLRIKEDARYILPMCTETQVGMTINARALEYMISYLCSQDIEELNELARGLLNNTIDTAPSIIKYTNPDKVYHENRIIKGDRKPELNIQYAPFLENVLVSNELDTEILAFYKFYNSNETLSNGREWALGLDMREKKKIFLSIFKDMDFFHSMPKIFESVIIDFEGMVSASCYAQLKRHRESAIFPQAYSYNNPIILPSIFKESDRSTGLFMETVDKFREIYYLIEDYCPKIRDYFLLNCNSRRVYCKFDLKSLYNFFRLRSDEHAQWEIRHLSSEIQNKLHKYNYFSLGLACGKDKFSDTKKELMKDKGD